jgi:molybdate transport system substrate-binding protein
VFPPDTHPPIVYPIALTEESREPAAEFLSSPAAKSIFEKHRFSVLP